MLAQFTKLKYDHFFYRRQLLLIKWNFGQIQTSELSLMNLLTLILGLDGTGTGTGVLKTNSCLALLR